MSVDFPRLLTDLRRIQTLTRVTNPEVAEIAAAALRDAGFGEGRDYDKIIKLADGWHDHDDGSGEKGGKDAYVVQKDDGWIEPEFDTVRVFRYPGRRIEMTPWMEGLAVENVTIPFELREAIYRLIGDLTPEELKGAQDDAADEVIKRVLAKRA